MRTRVLLADDQPVVRAGFRTMLELAGDLTIVGEAGDGRAAVEMARSARPDVVLMDIRMPLLDGIEATRAITADPELGGVRVLVLTTFEIDEYVFGALRAGASGFLLKDIDAADLQRAIRTVAAGHALLAPTVTRQVIERFAHAPADPKAADRLDVLTTREREAVRLAALGDSNDDIAARLLISPLTAKTHLNRAMAKLGARDRAQLVITAYETGLVAVGEATGHEAERVTDRAGSRRSE